MGSSYKVPLRSIRIFVILNWSLLILIFQINCLGTLLATVLPAFMPRCHRYVEDGCRILKSSKHEHFMVISPDGLLHCVEHCDGKCENALNLPIGPIAVEMKCPYSPIHNK